jgi:CHRD domain-containing protein
MRTQHSMTMWSSLMGLTLAVLLAAGCTGMSRTGALRLSGNQEVPPVPTNAAATTDIVVQLTKCPSSASSYSCPEILGSVYTTGVTGTAVDIERGRRGQSGPMVVTLMKVNNTTWAVPPFTFLNDEQYAAYQEGQLYINVRSAPHPNGEIRAQLTP